MKERRFDDAVKLRGRYVELCCFLSIFLFFNMKLFSIMNLYRDSNEAKMCLRSFENNWNTYKLLAHVRVPDTKVRI